MDVQWASRLQTNTHMYQPKQYSFCLFGVLFIYKVVIWPLLKTLLQRVLGKNIRFICAYEVLVMLGGEITQPNQKKRKEKKTAISFLLSVCSDQSRSHVFQSSIRSREDVAIQIRISLIGVFWFDLTFHFYLSAYRKMFSRGKYMLKLNLIWIN